jgi:hypothetical protein
MTVRMGSVECIRVAQDRDCEDGSELSVSIKRFLAG